MVELKEYGIPVICESCIVRCEDTYFDTDTYQQDEGKTNWLINKSQVVRNQLDSHFQFIATDKAKASRGGGKVSVL